jgi:hypothetical protein
MSMAQPLPERPVIVLLRAPAPARGAPGEGVDVGTVPGGSWIRGVVADLGAAALVTAGLVPVVATLLTAAVYIYIGVPVSRTDPTAALLGNLLLSWVILAMPCALLGLGRPRNVNRSAFEKIQSRLTEVCAWSDTPPTPSCANSEAERRRATAQNALKSHLQDTKSSLEKRGIMWALGTGYIGIWRRLNAAESLLAYVEPLEQVSTRAYRLSARLAESSMPGAAAMEATLNKARRAIGPKRTSAAAADGVDPRRRATRRVSSSGMSEDDIRGAVCEIQFAINEFRTHRYAGLVQARNLLLGASAVGGVALYALLWLALGMDGTHVGWWLAFYLVGAMVGIMNVLYTQASVDSSVEDYSLSTARVLVAPQLAGIAALIGVLLTASTAMTQGSDASTAAAASQFFRPVNFLAAAGFALSPGVVLSGLRKKTEDYKQEIKSSRTIGRHAR